MMPREKGRLLRRGLHLSWGLFVLVIVGPLQPQTPHVEQHFAGPEVVADIVKGEIASYECGS
jgi:hypothetical protein